MTWRQEDRDWNFAQHLEVPLLGHGEHCVVMGQIQRFTRQLLIAELDKDVEGRKEL